MSKFRKKRSDLPLAVRRMIIVAMVGSGALVILALAHWVRPPMSPQRRIERLAAECDEITETGEEFVGELDQCWTSLAHERAKLR